MVPVEPLEEHLLPVCLSSPSSVLVLVSRLGDRHRVLSELPICLLEMVGRSKLLEVIQHIFFKFALLPFVHLDLLSVLWSRSNLDRLRLPAPAPDSNIFVV